MAQDIFADVHNLEEDTIQKGFDEGFRDGLVAGIAEGRELGVQKGYEIGIEIGFYAGCVRMWQQLQERDSAVIPERSAKGLAALQEMLADFPLDNPQDERLQELLARLQGKFKAVASMLHCLQDYFPKDSPNAYAY